MSNPESFIDEVTEEVRRDKLFAMFRKYGWIGVLLVAGIVGGAAYNEWSKARSEAAARDFGDALLTAIEAPTPESRREALDKITVRGEQAALVQMLLSSDPQQDRAATLVALDKVIADASLPQIWHDLATLRRVIVAGAEMPLADRRAALEPLAAAGRPFRTMAAEQLAYLLVEDGKTEAAISALQALLDDQDAPGGLRSRAAQMIVALGGEPKQG
ncbi:hypothetical protein SAMN04488103_102397 [Gemmobacter aquatilis]|uniref:Tetratricopeptide repeat-like domain-containing protein n=1 Tax=Gemmobacter aquatilis TaxID=933059 RepID=A0A1H8C5M8_9RHOB|nr:hypothetical protein [Gemmobacter aquatilis]SEM90340.1 hypothetical protein SAMN04488103_102397 [Gemmobacter aquatilis]